MHLGSDAAQLGQAGEEVGAVGGAVVTAAHAEQPPHHPVNKKIKTTAVIADGDKRRLNGMLRRWEGYSEALCRHLSTRVGAGQETISDLGDEFWISLWASGQRRWCARRGADSQPIIETLQMLLWQLSPRWRCFGSVER